VDKYHYIYPETVENTHGFRNYSLMFIDHYVSFVEQIKGGRSIAMTAKVDFKKDYKDLYLPKTKPMLIDVPEIQFIAVDGAGDPNSEA